MIKAEVGVQEKKVEKMEVEVEVEMNVKAKAEQDVKVKEEETKEKAMYAAVNVMEVMKKEMEVMKKEVEVQLMRELLPATQIGHVLLEPTAAGGCRHRRSHHQDS